MEKHSERGASTQAKARHTVDAFFEQTYDQLRALASARLRSSSAALETTALVHEAFLRLARSDRLRVQDRTHFFRYAGRVMRAVIVDTVRERFSQRRGSGAALLTLSTQTLAQSQGLGGEDEILRVHEALHSLAQQEPRLVEVVQLRYFAGMTETEIAEVLGVTDRTVRRDWEKARVLLSEVLGA
jgi:RNA polymerase sigma factor (TIGR02999 family)